MSKLETQTIHMRCKAMDVDVKTGDVTLTLEQHQARAATAELLTKLVVENAEVDVVVTREVAGE